ncbi:MAG: prolyl oligopeptidase family serine peptidase [Clostridiales bacterium]|jgi:sialate O-acetylesterase|nr:prolyl oligopeptidase family serine peptidase [Clostridiales bacterium]
MKTKMKNGKGRPTGKSGFVKFCLAGFLGCFMLFGAVACGESGGGDIAGGGERRPIPPLGGGEQAAPEEDGSIFDFSARDIKTDGQSYANPNLTYPASLWDAPRAEPDTTGNYVKSSGRITAVNLDSIPYIDNTVAPAVNIPVTKVFAYIGKPESASVSDKVPGIVLIHGGDGSPWWEWVEKWVVKGYAAAAISTNGMKPHPDYTRITGGVDDVDRHLIPVENGGPRNLNGAAWNQTKTKPQSAQFLYHATSAAIVAGSYLKSLDFVDADKIGIHGGSWGGVITAIATGYDSRFAFSIPVYGGVSLDGSYGGQTAGFDPAREAAAVYDDPKPFSLSKTPTLMANSTRDIHFSADMTERMYRDAQVGHMLLVKDYKHGVITMWQTEEFYSFADSIVKGGKKLARFYKQPYSYDNSARFAFDEGVSFKSAQLVYCEKTLPELYPASVPECADWKTAPLTVGAGNEISAPSIPAAAKVYYYQITDSLNRRVSSELVYVGETPAASQTASFTVETGVPASAALVVSPLFTAKPVLQRGAVVTVYGKYTGTADKIAAELDGQSAQRYYGEISGGEFRVNLPPQEATPAGASRTITLYTPNEKRTLPDIKFGDVYIASGQSNMEMRLSGCQNADGSPLYPDEAAAGWSDEELRFVTLADNTGQSRPQEDLNAASWQVASHANAGALSAVAYFFGKRLRAELNVPVGIIVSAKGNTTLAQWLAEDDTLPVPPRFIDKSVGAPAYHRNAAYCYNGMISPLTRFAATGVVWYQGENQPDSYDMLLTLLIRSWRAKFDRNLSFTVVQLPGFDNAQTNEGNYAVSRALQKKAALAVGNATYSVNIDLGRIYTPTLTNIHPSDKKPVGERAADAALSAFYPAFANRVLRGSAPSGYERDGDDVLLEFSDSGYGLETRGGEITVQAQNESGAWVKASAVIAGKKLRVSIGGRIKAVKYAYCNFPSGGFLYNTEGYPAEGFNLAVV